MGNACFMERNARMNDKRFPQDWVDRVSGMEIIHFTSYSIYSDISYEYYFSLCEIQLQCNTLFITTGSSEYI